MSKTLQVFLYEKIRPLNNRGLIGLCYLNVHAPHPGAASLICSRHLLHARLVKVKVPRFGRVLSTNLSIICTAVP